MTDYTLYSYFRSSCSARLRIALNLKDLSYEQVAVNLLKGEQHSRDHKLLNPSATVPLLVVHGTEATAGQGTFKIGQSVAALEFLDEVHPDPHPLLPRADKPQARAVVRTLTLIVACDIQPVTNQRIIKRVKELGVDADSWNRGLIADGLEAYETIVKGCFGIYSVGDDITMADLCLVPAIWVAQRFGVDLAPYPTIRLIMDALERVPAIIKARYTNQPDTPAELRAS